MKVEFQWKDRATSLDIVSKFTCVVGDNSGEGKSKLLSRIEDGIQDGSLIINSQCGVVVASPANVVDLLEISTRKIIILDEFSVLRSIQLEKIKQSDHLFVCITRGLPLHLSYSYDGIYRVFESNGFLEFVKANTLNISSSIPDDSLIITEASKGHSEAELLEMYGITNVQNAGGRDRIYKHIDTKRSTTVLMDLGNIGQAYSMLVRKSKSSKSLLRFYDYQCFEQLLNDAPCLANTNKVILDKFKFDSLEQYYEKLVEVKTSNTNYRYQHGRPLTQAWHSEPIKNVLDSKTGRGLFRFIQKKLGEMSLF